MLVFKVRERRILVPVFFFKSHRILPRVPVATVKITRKLVVEDEWANLLLVTFLFFFFPGNFYGCQFRWTTTTTSTNFTVSTNFIDKNCSPEEFAKRFLGSSRTEINRKLSILECAVRTLGSLSSFFFLFSFFLSRTSRLLERNSEHLISEQRIRLSDYIRSCKNKFEADPHGFTIIIFLFLRAKNIFISPFSPF